jgi:hypothetical protein
MTMTPEQIDRNQRRVVCAACKMKDGTVVLGARHGDGRMREIAVLLGKKNSQNPNDQGFIDQRGVFMSRQEAWKVAKAAGQILYRCGGDTRDGGTLYSENLY